MKISTSFWRFLASWKKKIFLILQTLFVGGGSLKRSPISVHYDKLGLRVRAPGDLTDNELDEALDALIARTQSQESSCLQQLEIIFSVLNKVGVSSIEHCSVLNDNVMKRSEELKSTIRDYFQSDSPFADAKDISSRVCFFNCFAIWFAIWRTSFFYLHIFIFFSFSFFLYAYYFHLFYHTCCTFFCTALFSALKEVYP